MDERKRNIAVGLTTAIGIAGLLVMMLLFGDFTGLTKRTYTVAIQLPTAGGLHPGSRVQLSGIEVGHVEAVQLRRPPGTGVEVTAHIRDDIQIPESVIATIEAPLLGGSPVVALHVPADQPGDQYLPRNGSARIKGEQESIASALAQEVQAMLQQPMARLDQVAEQFDTLSREWQEVGRNLNLILEPRNVDDVAADGEGANLTTILTRTDRRLAELEEVLAGIDRYVNDDELFDDVRQTVAHSRSATEKADRAVGKLSESLNESITALRRRYIALADDMAGAVGSMRELVDEAREGEGTVGRLVKDPQLYENLNDTAERMQAAMDELRLLLQRWRAEGLPVEF